VARHFGGSQQRRQLCADIKQCVERLGLSPYLPLVKYEIGRGHEYYLGIAVDGNNEDAISSGRDILTQLGVASARNPDLCWVLGAEDTAGLLRGNLQCDSFTIPLVYEPDQEVPSASCAQILSGLDVDDLEPVRSECPESSLMDRLLYWCSATGSGDLSRMHHTCQLLGIGTEWGGVWPVIRRLTLLGHLEFVSSNGIRWSCVSPALVTSAEDDSRSFLSGQRTPALLQMLKEGFDTVEHAQYRGPSQITINGMNHEAIATSRQASRITTLGCVSRRMGELLPDFDSWVEKLPTWDERDFSRYQVERYLPHSDGFCAAAALSQPDPGLYRFSLKDDQNRYPRLALYDGKAGRWIGEDHYGLRFIARNSARVCRVAYRNTTKELLMPLSDRWPMPFERALVLANGLLPDRLQNESGEQVLSYSGVPRELAETLCSLLRLDMDVR